MLQIKDTIISLDLLENYFECDLNTCKGECCVEGDAGAPLTEDEKIELDENLDKILPLLSPGGRKAVKENGTAYHDEDGDLVTTLIDGGCCAFSAFEKNGLCLCALEKGFREGKLAKNLKPSSCSLYPVRLSRVGDKTALNIHKWSVCRCAFMKGRKNDVRIYEFLREPLIRYFGKDWYDELTFVASEWLKTNPENRN